MHSWVKQYNKRDAHSLLPQLLHGGICITILLHHLDHSHLKVLLSDVHSSLTNGIHTSFTAHSLDHKRLFRSHTLQSAPEQPASEAAIFFILMPLIKFIFRLWICKIARRPYTIFTQNSQVQLHWDWGIQFFDQYVQVEEEQDPEYQFYWWP